MPKKRSLLKKVRRRAKPSPTVTMPTLAYNRTRAGGVKFGRRDRFGTWMVSPRPRKVPRTRMF